MGNSPQDRNTGELITWNCGGSFEFLLQEVCLPVLSVSDLSTDCEPEGLCCCGRGVRHVPFSSTVSMAEDSKYSGLQIGARFIFFFFPQKLASAFFWGCEIHQIIGFFFHGHTRPLWLFWKIIILIWGSECLNFVLWKFDVLALRHCLC